MINLVGRVQPAEWRMDSALLVLPALVRKVLLDLGENYHGKQGILVIGLDKSKGTINRSGVSPY